MNQKRYKNQVFDKVESRKGIIYHSAENHRNEMQDLKADLYFPKGDTQLNRPLILFMHGGAFTWGSRSNYYAAEFCRSFAKRGYVTASLDYRLGVSNPFNPVEYGEAVYRSVQDLKAAIRYFRNNATIYSINPDAIFIGGASAGAIAALHAAYWRQDDVPFYLNAQKLGLLDETGNNSTKVKGVINCFGAIINPEYIREGDAPVVSVHGEKDPIVPYKSLTLGPFSISGSYDIHRRAKVVGIKSGLKSFPETGHGFMNFGSQKWKEGIEAISDFVSELVLTAEVRRLN